MDAKLGDKVRCRVTGFTGVVVAEHNYLHGCTRMTVQPGVDKDGKLPDTQTFDAPQLEVLVEEKHSRGNTTVGGPDKYVDVGRPCG